MTTSVSAKSEVKQSTGAVIKVDGLVKRYKDGTEALKNLILEVQPGELFGLVGPDGAGKSTALKILAGIMEPTSGKVSVLSSRPSEARRYIGYVAQGGALYPELSVDENLRYEAGMHGVGNREYAKLRETHLSNMGLLEFSDRLAGQLSGGMKQKLARAARSYRSRKLSFSTNRPRDWTLSLGANCGRHWLCSGRKASLPWWQLLFSMRQKDAIGLL